MDIEILDDKDNVLLGRREVRFTVRFMGPTPDRNVVKEVLRAKLGVDPALVVVGKIAQPFGSQRAEGEARVYKNEEGKRMEHEHIIKREAGKAGKAEEGKAEGKEDKAEKEAGKVGKAGGEEKEGAKHEKKKE